MRWGMQGVCVFLKALKPRDGRGGQVFFKIGSARGRVLESGSGAQSVAVEAPAHSQQSASLHGRYQHDGSYCFRKSK
jgi:hypothetical protein